MEEEIEAPVEVERDPSGFGMKKGTTVCRQQQKTEYDWCEQTKSEGGQVKEMR